MLDPHGVSSIAPGCNTTCRASPGVFEYDVSLAVTLALVGARYYRMARFETEMQASEAHRKAMTRLSGTSVERLVERFDLKLPPLDR